VTILKGVRIGARSVIAAGAVVTKSIPPDSVAAGIPAKVVRSITNPATNL
jgi:maltose O-acetyltransferase